MRAHGGAHKVSILCECGSGLRVLHAHAHKVVHLTQPVLCEPGMLFRTRLHAKSGAPETNSSSVLCEPSLLFHTHMHTKWCTRYNPSSCEQGLLFHTRMHTKWCTRHDPSSVNQVCGSVFTRTQWCTRHNPSSVSKDCCSTHACTQSGAPDTTRPL